jgi:DNA-binding IclR family transcriptional regulator
MAGGAPVTHYTVMPRIMDFLERQEEPLTVGAIARGAEVNRSSVRKLLADLGDGVEVDMTFPGSPTYLLKPATVDRGGL